VVVVVVVVVVVNPDNQSVFDETVLTCLVQ
jgi:hypothetical protein